MAEKDGLKQRPLILTVTVVMRLLLQLLIYLLLLIHTKGGCLQSLTTGHQHQTCSIPSQGDRRFIIKRSFPIRMADILAEALLLSMTLLSQRKMIYIYICTMTHIAEVCL